MADPLILLIGGAPGVGKSTLAKNLCNHLGIVHRLSTGFIREIIYSTDPQRRFAMSRIRLGIEGANDLSIGRLTSQTRIMEKTIKSCIHRAYHEGTSLIVEGVHIIPGLIEDSRITQTYLVTLKSRCDFRLMMPGNTHSKRKLTESDRDAVIKLDDTLVGLAIKHGVPIIVSRWWV